MPARRRPYGMANDRLRARLRDLEETLLAIRSGEVDALVVESSGEDRVFTLNGADQTYRLMVEQMPTGAATLSDAGHVLYCNAFLASLLDVPVQSVVSAPFASFLDASDALRLADLLRDAVGGGSAGELSIRTAGAGLVPAHVSLRLLPLAGGHVFCLIVTDLRETRRREEEHAQLQRERVARMAAEEANRLKDEFLATLSHELRAPLNAIMAWSHVLLGPSVDTETTTLAIQAIDRNVRVQSRLVADLLDVSRIVTGKFRVQLHLVRLADVIESVLDTVRPAASVRKIRLELCLDPAALVAGDAGRLQQVIWNLLGNATRFAHPGGVVRVRLEDTGSSVELSVTDDGPGIDPGLLPYVFDRFRQGDSSSTRQHGGLGLGLAVVRHLVELHGGTVDARNRSNGSGAVFVVRLPRQTSEDAPPPGAAARGNGWADTTAGPEPHP